MNPLSPLTYYRRHKGRAALLLGLIILATAGLYLMGALVWGVFVEPARSSYMALSKFSIVTPESDGNGPDPAVIAQIQAHPDVARVMPASYIVVRLPSVVPGEGVEFDLHALGEEDMPYFLERCGATLKDGRLPAPGTNGLLLTEDVAAILDVNVGDLYDALSTETYANVDAPLEASSLEVVGILESDVRLGLVSLEFLNNHEQYRNFPARYLVVAREGREAAVDDFLRSEIQTNRTDVITLTTLNERITNEALPGLALLIPPILIVTVAFSLVIVVVNRIANARRLPEYGILYATGRSKSWLIHRLTMETAALALVGWVVGIGLACAVLYLLKVTVFAPRGHGLDFLAWVPLVAALPIPATVVGFTFISVRRTLSRLDPVTVVERGALSQEGDRKPGKTALMGSGVNAESSRVNSASSPRPLASATFYRRHRRRAVLLISGMSVMFMAVVLFVFTLAVSADAQEPLLGYLSRVSIIRSPGLAQPLDPQVVARVRAHPAVERVIPVAPRAHMLGATIPPFTGSEASPFGVYAEDMAYLVELYGLDLKEGHLPGPGTNEMVIPESLAQNRDLEVGDLIGNPDRPAYPGASSLPEEFVISGIFARPSAPAEENWLGFVSLEFLENHQVYPLPDVPPLFVVPRAGQKDLLDDWLENELAAGDLSVLTYRREVARVQRKAQQDMLVMAALESAIAIVAAIALAVLNYVFVSERQSEFGVLHALGYRRSWLVGRVLGETAFTTGVAWGLSAVVMLLGLLYLRFVLFASLGLTFDLFNVSPWLYTLPIPVTILAVTTGTTAWTLSKLDPVSIIERR